MVLADPSFSGVGQAERIAVYKSVAGAIDADWRTVRAWVRAAGRMA